MATYAQLAMAAQGAKDRSVIEAAQEKELQRREKASKWGGWGRTLGLLGAGLSTGGMSLLGGAVLTGLGGLAGRSVGRALGGGRERDAEKDIDALFYQGAQSDYSKNIHDYQKGMRERMLTDAGRDMFSAYTFNKYMKPKVAEAWGDMQTKWTGRFGTDAEKLAMATGDPQALEKIKQAKLFGEDPNTRGIFGLEFGSPKIDGPTIGWDELAQMDLPAKRPLPPQQLSQNISPVDTEALMDTNLLNIAAPSSTNVSINQLPISPNLNTNQLQRQPLGSGILAPEFNPNFGNENYLNNAFNLWRGGN